MNKSEKLVAKKIRQAAERSKRFGWKDGDVTFTPQKASKVSVPATLINRGGSSCT
jgi:hypothetical protein